MIRIHIRRLGSGRWHLTVVGHAGQAPIGQDLVCAAVSTLVQTLAAGVEDVFGDAVHGQLEAGGCDLGLTAGVHDQEGLDQVMRVFAGGFARLARDHETQVSYSCEME
jgi:uncharacterized protein YsxB (DUF464 family)